VLAAVEILYACPEASNFTEEIFPALKLGECSIA
jgi:hypothetical protein